MKATVILTAAISLAIIQPVLAQTKPFNERVPQTDDRWLSDHQSVKSDRLPVEPERPPRRDGRHVPP